MGHGVIGNTTEFGSVIVGSSPATPTKFKLLVIHENVFSYGD